jgi:hypothetical protein
MKVAIPEATKVPQEIIDLQLAVLTEFVNAVSLTGTETDASVLRALINSEADFGARWGYPLSDSFKIIAEKFGAVELACAVVEYLRVLESKLVVVRKSLLPVGASADRAVMSGAPSNKSEPIPVQ